MAYSSSLAWLYGSAHVSRALYGVLWYISSRIALLQITPFVQRDSSDTVYVVLIPVLAILASRNDGILDSW